jgi:hypothetical protein
MARAPFGYEHFKGMTMSNLIPVSGLWRVFTRTGWPPCLPALEDVLDKIFSSGFHFLTNANAGKDCLFLKLLSNFLGWQGVE